METNHEKLLREAIAKETKIAAANIDARAPFEQYGIESVMIVAITRHLEKYYGELPKTLFFEYQTLEELKVYFEENHPSIAEEPAVAIQATSPSSPMAYQVEDNNGTIAGHTMITPVNTLEPVVASAINPDPMPAPSLSPKQQEVAIIGISGRFPMAENLDELWENLLAGKDCITEVPSERWDWRVFWNPNRGTEGTSYSRWGGFMDDIDKFDPLFFNMSKLEAEGIDPQERLFLQTVYHTLEDAGYTKSSLKTQQVGVWVGMMWSQYQLYGTQLANAGSSYASVANRVSYAFDFKGPSIGLDTMCSSSLATIHLACQSLQLGETDVAIAGGVNITSHPNKHLFLSKTGFASTDGRCRSFGDQGNGYVPGDGVGAVLLKPMQKAIADGDHIYGVVRGSAINHGGKTNGYTVPNPKAQAALIQTALENANIEPKSIGYVEAHGTGTALGDPIEIRALTQAFGIDAADETTKIPIGSIKSNLGHLESAAGFAGVAKVLLQMKHQTLVPSIHSTTLNPNIDFAHTPFVVQQENTPWLTDSTTGLTPTPMRACVSSFGAGGANAHLILEAYNSKTPQQPTHEHSEFLVPLSAQSEELLHKKAKQLIEFLNKNFADAPANHISPDANALLEQVALLLEVSPALLDLHDPLSDFGWNAALHAQFAEHMQQLGYSPVPIAVREDTTLKELLNTMMPSADNNAPVSIESIAFTLQTGREPMPYRLAIIADSHQSLVAKLKAYLKDNHEQGTYTNFVAKKNIVGSKAQDQALIGQLLANYKIDKLARLWCQGLLVDWHGLYQGATPHRASLPGNIFLKERCWVPNPTPYLNDALETGHPLLQKQDTGAVWANTLAYETTIGSQRPIWTDVAHHEAPYLSIGVVFELVYALANKANPSGQVTSLHWQQPVAVEEGSLVRTQATQTASGNHLEVLVNGVTVAKATQSLSNTNTPNQRPGRVDIDAIHANTSKVLTQHEFYTLLNEAGTTLGPCYQTLQGLFYNDREYIAKYEAFDTQTMGFGPGFWHGLPGIVETSYQMLKVLGSVKSHETPFTLENIGSYQALPEAGYILIKDQEDNRFSVQLLTLQGKVCLEWTIVLDHLTKQEDPLSRFFYKPVWELSKDTIRKKPQQNNQVLLVYNDDTAYLAKHIEQHNLERPCYHLVLGTSSTVMGQRQWGVKWDDEESMEASLRHMEQVDEIWFLGGIHPSGSFPATQSVFNKTQENSTLALFRLAAAYQKLGRLRQPINLKVLTNNCYAVLPTDRIQPFTSGVVGLAKTMGREYPKMNIELVDLGMDESVNTQVSPSLHEALDIVAAPPQGVKEYAIREGAIYQRALIPTQLPPADVPVYRKNGHYLVIGGTGNVGTKLSEWLAKAGAAHITWWGRRPIDEPIRENMARVGQSGTQISYQSVDITDVKAVKNAIAQANLETGPVHGVFHSAMDFELKRLNQQDAPTFHNAMKAKTLGSFALYNALKSESLDFMAFFSSGESFTGNVGWGSYAAACNFKDAFAQYIQQETQIPTHVINWGFWEGNERGDAQLLALKGIYPITQEKGMEALNRVIHHQTPQVMALDVEDRVLSMMGVRLEQKAGQSTKDEQPKPKPTSIPQAIEVTQPTMATPPLAAAVTVPQTVAYLNDLFGEVLKISPDTFDENEDLASYGVDSLIVINLHKAIEAHLGTIPATLFIDYQTIQEIASYLVENFQDGLASHLAPTPVEEETALVTDNGLSSPIQKQANAVEHELEYSWPTMVEPPTVEPPTINKPAESTAVSLDAVVDYLTETFAEVLKIGQNSIDPEEDLAEYGVDSLIVINLHKAVEENLGTIPATLLIDYQTVKEVAEYLHQNHGDALNAYFGTKTAPTVQDTSALPVQNGNGHAAKPPKTADIVTGDIELVRSMPIAEGLSFLENYGQRYQDKTLDYEGPGAAPKYTMSAIHNEFEGQFVQIKVPLSSGKKIEVVMAGQGTPVLFMPAVALTAPVWFNQFKHLTHKYKVIVIHTPGYGLSAPIKEAHARGVGEVFAETIKILSPNRKLHAVGSCFGCITAQYLAGHHQELLASLTLVGGFYDNIGIPDIDPNALSIDELFEMVQTVSGSLRMDFEKVEAQLPATEQHRAAPIKHFADLLINSQCANPLVAMKYLNELLTLNTLPWLQEVALPAYILYGNHDIVVSPDASKVLHEHLANAQIEEITGAGHYPFLTHEDVFNPLLEGFIDRIENLQ